MKPTMPRMRSFRQRASVQTRKVLEEPEAVATAPVKKSSTKSSLRLLGRSSRRSRTTDNSLATESTARSSRTTNGFLSSFKKSSTKGPKPNKVHHHHHRADKNGGGGADAEQQQWSSDESSCKSLSDESSCGSLFVDETLDTTTTTPEQPPTPTQTVVVELPLDLKADVMDAAAAECPQTTPRVTNKGFASVEASKLVDEYGDSESEDEEDVFEAAEINNASSSDEPPEAKEDKDEDLVSNPSTDIPTLTESQETGNTNTSNNGDGDDDDEEEVNKSSEEQQQVEESVPEIEVTYDYYDHSCHDYGEVITQQYDAGQVVTQSVLPASVPEPKLAVPRKQDLHIIVTTTTTLSSEEQNEDARDELEEYGYLSDEGKYRPATPVQLTMIGDIDETTLLVDNNNNNNNNNKDVPCIQEEYKKLAKSPRPWQSDSQQCRGWDSFTPTKSSFDDAQEDSSSSVHKPLLLGQQRHSLAMPL